MEIELREVRDFLAGITPFDTLPAEQLDALPRRFVVRYLRRGQVFPPADGDQPAWQLLRSGAVELRDDDDRLVEKLGEGDHHAADCQLSEAPKTRGIAVEDSLLYQLPCQQLQALCREFPTLDAYFCHPPGSGLHRATAAPRVEEAYTRLDQPVATLLRRAPITGAADASIQDTARLMDEKNVSSVMLLDAGRLAGMVTDSDLRSQCISNGLDIRRPVADIMSTTVRTVGVNTAIIDALMTMTRHHIGHLPVVDGERVVGMLTATDIARSHSNHAGFMAVDIRKADSVDALATIARRLPEVQLQLARANATPAQVGEAISRITDTLTVRLIELAEAELGPPPVRYVWMCGGSQARREQTAHSDQDNALLLDDAVTPEQRPWFEQLARRVNDGLDACGFVYCPGDAMASNPQWRQPLQQWRTYFDDWVAKPDPKALMLTSIFFDLRPVHGDRVLFNRLHGHILGLTKENGLFTAYMAGNALQHRPPLGFFRSFVLVHDGEHDATLDLKRRALAPLTDIARCFALNQGISAVNTIDRLAAATAGGAISAQMGANLQHAHTFIASLRIQHQAKQIKRGEKPDNFVPPTELSELERKHLKDAFKVIQLMQETLENRYQLGRFR